MLVDHVPGMFARWTETAGHRDPRHARGRAVWRRGGDRSLLLQLRPQSRVPPTTRGGRDGCQRRGRAGGGTDCRTADPPVLHRHPFLAPGSLNPGTPAPARCRLRGRCGCAPHTAPFGARSTPFQLMVDEELRDKRSRSPRHQAAARCCAKCKTPPIQRAVPGTPRPRRYWTAARRSAVYCSSGRFGANRSPSVSPPWRRWGSGERASAASRSEGFDPGRRRPRIQERLNGLNTVRGQGGWSPASPRIKVGRQGYVPGGTKPAGHVLDVFVRSPDLLDDQDGWNRPGYPRRPGHVSRQDRSTGVELHPFSLDGHRGAHPSRAPLSHPPESGGLSAIGGYRA